MVFLFLFQHYVFIRILTTSRNVLISQTWIIESCSTHHISHDLILFVSISYDLKSTITEPTGMNVMIAGVKVIKLNSHITIISPFELLYSKVPDYYQVRVFGFLCYQFTSTHNRHKFQPRSRTCVFLGYLQVTRDTNYWIWSQIRSSSHDK